VKSEQLAWGRIQYTDDHDSELLVKWAPFNFTPSTSFGNRTHPFTPVLGWTLSIIEAVGLMIAVGLIVDFSAHLSYAFVSEPVLGKKSRTQRALDRVSFAILCSTGN
jgi:hypothetical protein